MAYQQSSDAHHEHHHANYLAIFIALCICTILSVAFDLMSMNGYVLVVLVLAVAVAKAQFVMRYFMHLKFEGAWKYVLLLPTAILACGLPLALAPDIGLHYYTPEVPQVRAAATSEANGHHDSGAHEPEGAEHHHGEAH